MRKHLPEILFVLLLSAAPAGAAQVTVSNAWFRALPGALPAAGYFTVRNMGASEIAVTGAQAKACGSLMLHQSKDTGGMSSMAMVEKVPVAPGESAKFAPGGYHLMCEGARLKVGTKIPVALRFSDGTSQVVSFAVRGATGK